MLSFIRVALVVVFHNSNSNSNEHSGLSQVGGNQLVTQCQMVNCENMYTNSIKYGFNGPYEGLYMSAITIPEKKKKTKTAGHEFEREQESIWEGLEGGGEARNVVNKIIISIINKN